MGFGPCEDPSGGGMAATDGVPPIGVITSGDLVWEGLHESSKQSSGAPPFDGLGIRCFVFGNGAGASSTVVHHGHSRTNAHSAALIVADGRRRPTAM